MTSENPSLGALTALAEIGGGGLIGPLISVFGADLGLSLNDRRFLAGPLIVHQSAWMDIVPKWMASQAIAERVEIVRGTREGIVGPTEIAAVMMPWTFEAPLGYEMTELYLWASTAAVARHTGRPVDEIWAALEHQRSIPDTEVVTRGGRLWHLYQPLAYEIRRKVIQAQAKREKEERRQEPAAPARNSNPSADCKPQPKAATGGQLSMF